jgi:cholesterol transport system auxiliary component
MIARAMALAALVAAAGCALMTPADVATRKELLSALPAEVPQGRARPVTLLVFPPDSAPVYDTTQMAYARQAQQIEYFARNAWSEKPSRMMHDLLVRTLEATHAFQAVVKPPHTEAYTHAVKSEIIDFHQDFTAEPAVMRIAMRFTLVSERSEKVVATKELQVAQPMREKSPEAGVEAASAAAQKLLRDAAAFVLEKAA